MGTVMPISEPSGQSTGLCAADPGANCILMGQESLFQSQESDLPPIPAPPGSCQPHLPPQLHLPAPEPSTAEPPAPASASFAYGSWSLEPANCQERQEPATRAWQCGALLGHPHHLSPGTQSFRAAEERTGIRQNRAAPLQTLAPSAPSSSTARTTPQPWPLGCQVCRT